MSGISLITKGFLTDYISTVKYNVLPFDISIQNTTKKINVILEDLKKCNLIKIDSKKLNLNVLDKKLNLELNNSTKVNVKRR